MPFLIAAFAVYAFSGNASAATPTALCDVTQHLAFACSTREPEGQLALCMPAPGGRAPVALRFTAQRASTPAGTGAANARTAARTLHSAPAGQALAAGGFGFAASKTPGSERVALRFEGADGNQMLIHQRVAGREIAGWVKIDADDEWHYAAVCERVTVMRLPALRDALVCDPHNQLGVKACAGQ
ncbi:hypothetical protein [Piscinibacterium candidicorallinum]|uniref:Uncharacterized protein n=1 Tax=Piscinibacterium candidicorallinum TaxID=1793872 RepID=A0ABV7H8A4_9BURK